MAQTVTVAARVTSDLKDKFEEECKEQGINPSDALRTFIKSFADGTLLFKEAEIDVRD